MSADGATEPRPSEHPHACPGFDATRRWDEPPALRGEILSADRLVAHAVDIARAHGEPSQRGVPRLLWQRFESARSSVRQAYEILNRDLQNHREPSPAEEWLLDNSHVIEEQFREIEEDLPRGYLRKLPRLASGAMRGCPSVYGLCLDYLRHTDARVDLGTLSNYVLSYQEVRVLTIGELWAVPIMLRLGLLLTVAAIAQAETGSRERVRGDEWADRLLLESKRAGGLDGSLGELERAQPITAAFLVQLLRRLREHDEPGLSPAFDWISKQSAKLGALPEELVRRQLLRQAADQVSVGNAVTSMRAIAAFDWHEFFERTSAVEALLRKDPAGAYAETDPTSRDRYRHAVEALARRSRTTERGVAQAALELSGKRAATLPLGAAPTHVGYFLLDDGRRELERGIGYRPRVAERLRRAVTSHATAFYFSTLALVGAAIWALAAAYLAPGFDFGSVVLLFALSLLASEIAVDFVNGLAVAGLSPRLLPRFAFKQGVPAEYRTLVAVPALLENRQVIDRLLADLEVRSLANSDKFLHFALVTDFVDADREEIERDAELLEYAAAGIDALNQRHGDGRRYWLLHRRRTHNQREERYMGWDRKRGKLEELNRLLRGATDTTFTRISADTSLFPSIRYVITLDADTELPRETARKLVATLAHPLNRAELDPARRRVVRGYAIAQPRVGTLPESSRQSRFASLAAGPAGIDPYTTAVSDVYQDLFGEGSYVGKGIYDVDAFSAALDGRVPENLLLSHDLFEGLYARSALVTDVEVLDEQPAAYEVQSLRQHRWIRGDWQLIGWLFPRIPMRSGKKLRSDLRLLDWWKLFDNLRRSLLAPAIVFSCVVGWLGDERTSRVATLALAAVLLAPILLRLVFQLARDSRRLSPVAFGALGGDLGSNAIKVGLSLVVMLDQALVALDAISRTLYRLLWSKRRLMEWRTMRQSARLFASRGDRAATRTWLAAALAAGFLVLLAFTRASNLPFAAPVLGCWMVAPLLVSWLSRSLTPPRSAEQLSDNDRAYLRSLACKTWRYFETFVTAGDNYLPPDNYQEDPRGVVAHRTSPTNIGLYLLSTLAARDLGYLTAEGLVERIGRTLDTLERMERRFGHILNWYDTETLRPLDPQYVSTVDSGNLVAALWTLRQGLEESCTRPILGSEAFHAVGDLVGLARGALARSGAGDEAHLSRDLRQLEQRLYAINLQGDECLRERLRSLQGVLDELNQLSGSAAPEPAALELGRARDAIEQQLAATRALVPFLDCLERAPRGLREGAQTDALRALEERLSRAHSIAAIAELAPAVLEQCGELRLVIDSTGPSPEERVGLESYVAELEHAVKLASLAAQALEGELGELGRRAVALADAMDFGFLFDEGRELFVTGYNVGSARRDSSHYDLLASEARLASLIALARGEVPQEHWFRLGRPRTAVASRRCLLSWSGSMFEFLMPLLVTRNHPDTLLHETCESAVIRQHRYGRERGVPWGVSESSYNVMDFGMTYQYRAFGVPGLGLKAGLGEDLVIAPYATALAAMVRPDLAVENLRALSRAGLDGPYGHYEAIDFTPAHVPPGRKAVVVKSFMAHHQGMSLVAIDNVLNDFPMPARFHRDARIKASELLLEERVPVRVPLVKLPAAAIVTAPHGAPELDVTEHVGLGASPPRLHLLGHGELSTLVSSTGSGVTTWKGLDVNRFREDPVLDEGGIYIYVRNLSAERHWSAAFQPTRVAPDSYDASFSIDRVEFHRRDGDVETVTQILPSPEHSAEVRRLILINHGPHPLDLDLTTYTEVVLAPRSADLAHRAFGSMFIETEALPAAGALLARRRPRSASEPEVWLVQLLTRKGEDPEGFEFDTTREGFIGRGRDLRSPVALGAEKSLAGKTGYVLDPAFSMRRKLRLEPGKHWACTLVTGLASSRDEALDLIEAFTAPHAVGRTFELGWADARVELKHLGIDATEVHRFQRLLSAVIYPRPGLREREVPRNDRSEGRTLLWGLGISGDLPIVVLRIDQADFTDLCRELLLAHEYYRMNGVSIDLVLLNEEPSGYAQPMQEAALGVIRACRAEGHADQRGGVHLRRADTMSEDQRVRLLGVARVVLSASKGSLSRQLRQAVEQRALSSDLQPLREGKPEPAPAPLTRPALDFDNGVGGFADSGREYVIPLEPSAATPAPWCNVFANPNFGALITETGAGFTWFGNSQRHRLTPWSNDAVVDPSGELLYVRDDEDGSIWSPTPRPLGSGAHFLVRHGQGYTQFEHRKSEIEQTLSVFVSPDEPVKIYRLRLENRGATPRRLSIFGVVEWVLGSTRDASRASVVTNWDRDAEMLLATNPLAMLRSRHAFFTATQPIRSFTADREEFFGLSGSRSTPRALGRATLSGRFGAGLDPCGALQVPLRLAPGETQEVSFVLGDADGPIAARSLALKYANDAAVARTFGQVTDGWDDLLGKLRVKTPDPALDPMVNRWLLYQVLSCRFWARSGFYQSSGAYGFRDQLQDVLALLHTRPELARAHILRCASRQFVEGDVQHWWHPDAGDGVRTHCSDDLLWLPYAVAEYVRVTGDAALLDEQAEFLTERELDSDEEDLFSVPRNSGAASIYEHCTRALDRGATAGPHGLPLIGSCDWNDGMNRVGQHGQGESVWLAWFLAKALEDFAEIAELRGDAARVDWCRTKRSETAAAADAHGWDGSWYRRAYFDDGTPLGTQADSECRIDAIAQSWSVIAGAGNRERAALALSKSVELLLREEPKTLLLLWPAFDRTPHDPGYIKAYPPGIRENGGQYTHGVLWTVDAFARLGDGDRAGKLLNLLNPIEHARTFESCQRYRVEPYVVAADIYSAPGHDGRGGWTWYTGSAAWMYRVALESVLGFVRRGDVLVIDPCIPKDWPGFEIEYRHRDSVFSIKVENPNGVCSGVLEVKVDGSAVDGGRIRLDAPGSRHEVRVVMGERTSDHPTARDFAHVHSEGGTPIA